MATYHRVYRSHAYMVIEVLAALDDKGRARKHGWTWDSHLPKIATSLKVHHSRDEAEREAEHAIRITEGLA